MSELKPHQETSMEEILASIRRIVSEDSDDAQGSGNTSTAAVSDTASANVFTLTQRAEQDSAVPVSAKDNDMIVARNIGVETVETPKPAFTLDFDALNFDESAESSPKKEMTSSAEVFSLSDRPTKTVSMNFDEETLISPSAASAATQALARLKELDNKREESPEAAVKHASGGGNPTINDLVQEALKPILRDWIDQNLTSIVEALVAKEIQRLADSIRRG